MRHKRRKNYRRHLKVLEHQFGLHVPYDVLVDGNFLYLATKRLHEDSRVAKSENPLAACFAEVLSTSRIRLWTTYAVLKELRSIDSQFFNTHYRKRIKILPKVDGDKDDDVQTSLLRKLKSPSGRNWFLASQDVELMQEVRSTLPGTSTLTFTKTLCVLEPLSFASQKFVQAPTAPRRASVVAQDDAKRNEPPRVRRPSGKRKAKGPNPLSVKKKKKR